ncbi:hypothetical protein NEOLEDRAFT_1149178 [Neolentinus lepideus HHB14362 ss-1]|uniref:Uncharacterized protein n=1 Tax=Neolentinus lepideus HHB14362 ss-1 TaxID=1314782 RepID=A0A165RDF7_9AGAM|nr:hypothetical protein NEOLEDRAFT_1149178 [Neolentinus lepideus HHB14362 ss-1]
MASGKIRSPLRFKARTVNMLGQITLATPTYGVAEGDARTVVRRPPQLQRGYVSMAVLMTVRTDLPSLATMTISSSQICHRSAISVGNIQSLEGAPSMPAVSYWNIPCPQSDMFVGAQPAAPFEPHYQREQDQPSHGPSVASACTTALE